MVWIPIRTDLLSTLIWVQTFCKGYQQKTKVAPSKERAKNTLALHQKSYYQLQKNCQFTMYIERHHKAPIKMASDDTFSDIFFFYPFPPSQDNMSRRVDFSSPGLVTKTVFPDLGVTDGWKVPGIVAKNNYIFSCPLFAILRKCLCNCLQKR